LYPKCGKTGHTQGQCFLKKRDQKAAAFKRAGKSKGKEKHGDKKLDSRKQVPGSKSFTGCHCCGDSDHRAFECPDREEGRGKGAQKKTRFEVTSESKSTRDKEKTKRQKTGWNKFVRHDDRGTVEDSDDDGVNMLQEESDISEGAFMSEENDVVFLDSCASKRLFIVRDQSFLQNFVYSAGSIQTTRTDAQLASLGTGSYGDWKDIRVCNGAVENICSGEILSDMGYGLSLLRVPRVVRLLVLIASYAENGMPFVSLVDLLDLPNLTVSDKTGESSEEVHLSDNMDADPVDLLHDRCGHFSNWKHTDTCCSLEAACLLSITNIKKQSCPFFLKLNQTDYVTKPTSNHNWKWKKCIESPLSNIEWSLHYTLQKAPCDWWQYG
jgi:hypothetical protein